MLRGVDVSDWQPDIDWSAVAADGWSFAIVKATQGTRNVQTTFAPYRVAIPAAGMGPVGLYHFAQDGDPVAQADHFCDVVGHLGSDEFAVLDIEANPDYFTLALSQWPWFIHEWCGQVGRRIGGPVVVYMSESPAKSMTADCARWPLWVAGYQSHAPTEWEDWQVGPWASPVIWQWSSSYSVPGIGAVDQNIAPDDLRSRLGIDTAKPVPVPTPPAPPQEDDMATPHILLSYGSGVALWHTSGDVVPLATSKQVTDFLGAGAIVMDDLTAEQIDKITGAKHALTAGPALADVLTERAAS